MNSPLAPDTLNQLVPLCSGCGACMNSCPKNAIKLVPDAEGFVRPRVHSMDCTGCKTCIRICPVLHAESHPSPQQNPLAVYAGWNKDESIRLASSSGGIFSALAISTLKKGGTVYGAAMGENLRVRHIRITTPEELSTLRGSKYIQSDTGWIYRTVKKDLKEGLPVLFSGTPCQIAALHQYLKRAYPLLLCVDIICHGVPSPKLFQEYIRLRESGEENRKVTSVQFRDKRVGWKSFSMVCRFGDGKAAYAETLHRDLFMQGFLGNFCLRPSCYACAAHKERRHADITLGDFWGVDLHMPELDDDKGTSLIFIHSAKGESIWREIQDAVFSKPVPYELAVRYNHAYHQSFPHHPAEKLFHDNIGTIPLEALIAWCHKKGQPSLLRRIARKVKRSTKRIWNRRMR